MRDFPQVIYFLSLARVPGRGYRTMQFKVSQLVLEMIYCVVAFTVGVICTAFCGSFIK